MAKTKKRTRTEVDVTKLSPQEREARAKRLAYVQWKTELEKEGKWKKRDQFKARLNKIRAQFLSENKSAAPAVVEAPEKHDPVADKLDVKGNSLSALVEKLEAAQDVVADLKAKIRSELA